MSKSSQSGLEYKLYSITTGPSPVCAIWLYVDSIKLYNKSGQNDQIRDDMELQTETNFNEWFKHVEVKQMDEISAAVEDEKNVDVICKLVSYGGKRLCVWKWWSS